MSIKDANEEAPEALRIGAHLVLYLNLYCS